MRHFTLILVALTTILLTCCNGTNKKQNDSSDTNAAPIERIYFSKHYSNLLQLLKEGGISDDFDNPDEYSYFDVDEDGIDELFWRNGDNIGVFAYNGGTPVLVRCGDFKISLSCLGQFISTGGSCGSGSYYSTIDELQGSKVVGSASVTSVYGIIDAQGSTDTVAYKAMSQRTDIFGALKPADNFHWNPIDSFANDTTAVADSLVGLCYAYANEDGTKLIIPDLTDEQTAARYEIAICNGNIIPVTYVGIQPRNENKDNRRNVSANFNNQSGAVFSVPEDAIPINEEVNGSISTCFLMTDKSFFKNNRPIAIMNVGEELDRKSGLWKELESRYKRKMEYANIVFSFGNEGENIFVSAQFSNQGDEALGIYAMAFTDGQGTIKSINTIDFPATFNEISTWTVDDSGHFNTPEANAMYKCGDKYILYTVKSGTESTNFNCYKIADGKITPSETSLGSFYTSPL